MGSTFSPQTNQFAIDVLEGLSAEPKSLSSKYFYDDEGSRLFQRIMALPEYYLTRSEFEIFSEQGPSIVKAFAANEGSIDLVELGAGDGTKTSVLVKYFIQAGVGISYSPIDISDQALESLSAKFRHEFPNLTITPERGDYFSILDSLKSQGGRKVLMFLGSNIGNFGREASLDFFRRLRGVMNENDLLFVGFDLQKDPHVIARAYDDSEGVTAQFNLNLLTRINRELGGDFDIEKFTHYALYSPTECAARSFLISRERQTVNIAAAGRQFEFAQWEPIFMEISQKYSLEMITELAVGSGFVVAENFFDSRQYFCDSLWRPV